MTSNTKYDKIEGEVGDGLSEELKFRDFPYESLDEYEFPYPTNSDETLVGWSILAKNNSKGDFYVTEYKGFNEENVDDENYNPYIDRLKIQRDGIVRVLTNDFCVDDGDVVISNGDVIINGTSLMDLLNDLVSRIETLETS